MYFLHQIDIGIFFLSFQIFLLSYYLIITTRKNIKSAITQSVIINILPLNFIINTIWFCILSLNFLNTNTNYIYILENSSIVEPFLYKIGSIWSSKEGALSLWIWLSSLLYFKFTTKFKFNISRQQSVMLTKPLIGLLLAFLLILFLLNNPFTPYYNYIPFGGTGITLLLKDILLIIHPPFLYVGYILSSLLFVFSYYLIKTKKQYVIFENLFFLLIKYSICFLLIGIFLGGFWSYLELGWGGFWNWDAVENLSLIPLLLNFMLLHFKSKELYKFNLKFRLLTTLFLFLLCFISTLIIRSGLLVSIHAFALTTTGFTFLILIIIAHWLTYIFIFLNTKIKDSKNNNIQVTFLNNKLFYLQYAIITFLISILIIFCLTILPYFIKIITKTDIAVGPQIYNNILLYIIIPSLGIIMFYYIKKQKIFNLSIFLIFFVFTFNILYNLNFWGINLLLYFFLIKFGFLSYYSLNFEKYINKKAFYAHITFSFFIFVLILYSLYENTTYHTVEIGNILIKKPFIFLNNGFTKISTTTLDIYYNTLSVYKQNTLFQIATPEKYFSKLTEISTLKPYIITTPFYDLYIIFYNITTNGLSNLIISYKPLIFFIWFSFLNMILSNIFEFKKIKTLNYFWF